MTEALVGETVDTRYELRRLIAHGGMGLVFEATHKFTRRIVALKLLPDDLRAQKEARGRLLREAHALTAVRHPGFVEVLDAGVCAAHGTTGHSCAMRHGRCYSQRLFPWFLGKFLQAFFPNIGNHH